MKIRPILSQPKLSIKFYLRSANLIFGVLASTTSWAGQISLAWDANTQAEVAGYKVYYGTSSGQYTKSLDVGNQTTAVITNLTDGASYYFAVTDYNADHSVESQKSNEVLGVVPVATQPTPTPTPTPIPISGGQTLFTTQVPQSFNNSDGATTNYELGMRFMSTSSGTINAIRFYKDSFETGTHTGKIYSASGALLTSVVFSGETASGWQQQALSSPLSITANTEYTVSVNTGNTYYVATNSGMAIQLFNGNLVSMLGNNGVYGAIGARPTASWLDSNYFRDVVFVAGSSPSPMPNPIPTIDSQAPVVSLSSPLTGTSVAASTTVPITATASDNIAVTKVEFYVNSNLLCTDSTAPYSCSWRVPRRKGRTFNIQVKAYDAAGNIGRSKVVTVTSK